MTKVEHLEREVRGLSPEELATFREWFVALDSVEWDRQIEADAERGKLITSVIAVLARPCDNSGRRDTGPRNCSGSHDE